MEIEVGDGGTSPVTRPDCYPARGFDLVSVMISIELPCLLSHSCVPEADIQSAHAVSRLSLVILLSRCMLTCHVRK